MAAGDETRTTAISDACDVDAEVRQARSRYIEQHGEWFRDQEGAAVGQEGDA